MGREDKYLSRILGYSRKNARTKNRHNCIINHVRDQQTITESGISYNPIPTARDFAGGQVWFRKGMLMIILWRPPYGLANAEGKPYKETETLVKIAKSKPKGVSKNGLNSMHFDVDRISYYVENNRGQRIYADRGEYNNKEKVKEPEQITIETAIRPNMAFDAPVEIDNNNDSDWFNTANGDF